MASINKSMLASFTDDTIPQDESFVVSTYEDYGSVRVYKYHDHSAPNKRAVFRTQQCPDPKCLDCVYSVVETAVSSVSKMKVMEYEVLNFPPTMLPRFRNLESSWIELLTKYESGITYPPGNKAAQKFDPFENPQHKAAWDAYFGSGVSKDSVNMTISADKLMECTGFTFVSESLFRSLHTYMYDVKSEQRLVVGDNNVLTVPYSKRTSTSTDETDQLILRVIACYAKLYPDTFVSTLNNLNARSVMSLYSVLTTQTSVETHVNTCDLCMLNVEDRVRPALKLTFNNISIRVYLFVDWSKEMPMLYLKHLESDSFIKIIKGKSMAKLAQLYKD